MKSLIAATHLAIHKGVEHVGVAMTLVFNAFVLAVHLPSIRRADVVVVMGRGGFGHTIHGPDIVRRLYQGKRCVFIAFSDYKRHNWKVASIWPDLQMFFLSYNVGMSIGTHSIRFSVPDWYRKKGPNATIRIARAIAPKGTTVLPLDAIYQQVSVPQAVLEKAIKIQAARSIAWNLGYPQIMLSIPAAKAKLPERWQLQVLRKLSSLSTSGPASVAIKRCCLYLRKKGQSAKDPSDKLRVGSDFEDYTGAIDLLVKAGYQVWVTGDRRLPKPILQQFHGMVVSGDYIGVKSNIWSLYAATEADIFVGETGGGTWLPGVNGMPRLVLNAYPYFYGFPRSWIFYKTVRDQTGHLVDYHELFQKHAYSYDLPTGMTVHANTKEEITDAVAQFLTDIQTTGETLAVHDNGNFIPEHTWFKQAHAKLSPAFVRKFAHGNEPAGGVGAKSDVVA